MAQIRWYSSRCRVLTGLHVRVVARSAVRTTLPLVLPEHGDPVVLGADQAADVHGSVEDDEERVLPEDQPVYMPWT